MLHAIPEGPPPRHERRARQEAAQPQEEGAQEEEGAGAGGGRHGPVPQCRPAARGGRRAGGAGQAVKYSDFSGAGDTETAETGKSSHQGSLSKKDVNLVAWP